MKNTETQQESPDLPTLLHHLTECPTDFLELSRASDAGSRLAAVICDHFRPVLLLDFDPFISNLLEKNRKSHAAAHHYGLIAIGVWLLRHEWFLQHHETAEPAWKWLCGSELKTLAAIVPVPNFVSDPDRREEIVRMCLTSLALIPRGETQAQADDRRTTLDSIERQRVLGATAAAERRAREVREAMAREKAKESASRYGE